jgi:hypothetical protein
MVASRTVMAAFAALVAALVVAAAGNAQQLPLEPIKERGQGVFPVYEGWFKNADGTFTFLVGYFNRNTKEAVDVPVGPDNKIEPGPADQGQPTHFEPRRGWGVFTVTVPKDFGTKKLTWTLNANGMKASVPMHLDPNWYIEPFEDAASKNRPPALRFTADGAAFEGPPRGFAASFTTSPGVPLSLQLWATDVKPTANVRANRPGRARLGLSWTQFRGPGSVKFDQTHPEAAADGTAATTATFDRAGEYILRVEATDETGEGGGGFQCCWTSALVRVTVRGDVQLTGQ